MEKPTRSVLESLETTPSPWKKGNPEPLQQTHGSCSGEPPALKLPALCLPRGAPRGFPTSTLVRKL